MGELRFPQCTNCGRFQWYPLPRCPSCGGSGWRWQAVPPTGTVISYTVLHRAWLPGFDHLTPYAVLQVGFPVAPEVRFVTRLQDNEQIAILRVEAPLTIDFVRASDDITLPLARLADPTRNVS